MQAGKDNFTNVPALQQHTWKKHFPYYNDSSKLPENSFLWDYFSSVILNTPLPDPQISNRINSGTSFQTASTFSIPILLMLAKEIDYRSHKTDWWHTGMCRIQRFYLKTMFLKVNKHIQALLALLRCVTIILKAR